MLTDIQLKDAKDLAEELKCGEHNSNGWRTVGEFILVLLEDIKERKFIIHQLMESFKVAEDHLIDADALTKLTLTEIEVLKNKIEKVKGLV